MSVRQREVAMTADMVHQRVRVMNALQLRRSECVLEVGCGNGLLAREMAYEVGLEGRVTGADIIDSMLTMARGAHADRVNIEFMVDANYLGRRSG
ncbi:MAG: methyltransferase domain-containing protein [Rhodoferax sp.]|nr:methyltransferase domain-containing protein [Rhodoferax sp.]